MPRTNTDALVAMQSQEHSDIPDVCKGLTPKRLAFAKHYAAHHMQTKSCRLAGISEDYGYHLVKEPQVQAAIAYYEALYAEKSEYSPEKIIRQWSFLASINILDYVKPDNTWKTLEEMTPEERRLLGEGLVGLELVPTRRGTVLKPRFAKVEALEALGRLLGMYKDETSRDEGLTLVINMAPDATGVPVDEDIGPFKIRLPGAKDVPRLPQETE